MFFPDDFILEIKYRNDIEDIISRYVTLKSNGSSTMVGLCPFHSERSPSFTVFNQSKSFYCFGCGVGGDVVTFVMRMESLDYKSAMIKLAEWAGMPLPVSEDDKSKLRLQKRIFELNREAALYFYRNLFDDKNEESRNALEYLTERKLAKSTIKHFGIGYAPKSRNTMTNLFISKGFTQEELKLAFLSGTGKTGGYIDYFRGRIIFPILDLQKRVIAFGGRAMGNAMPKYLNTSNTLIFKKSCNLYALNFAKNSKSDYLILCEGYMDVIAMHQAGFTGAVATLGTAVTTEQARIANKYAKEVILCYDSDEAGKRASVKAYDVLKGVGATVRILNINPKDAKDPDEYIKKFGAERFLKLIKNSKNYIEETIDQTLSKYSIDNDDEKIKALNELCEIISQLDSPIEQEVYGVKISKALQISSESILTEIKRKNKRRVKKERNEQINLSLRKTEGYGDKVNPEYSKNPRASKAEEGIIGILLNYPEYFDYIKDKINEESFFTEFNKKVFTKFCESAQKTESIQKFDISFLFEHFTPEESGRITKIMLDTGNRSTNNETEIDLLISTLEEEKIKEKKKGVNIGSLSNDEWAKMMEAKRIKSSIIKEGEK